MDSTIYIRDRGQGIVPILLQEVVSQYEAGKLSGNTDVSLDGKRWVTLHAFVTNLPRDGRRSPSKSAYRLTRDGLSTSPQKTDTSADLPPYKVWKRSMLTLSMRPWILAWILSIATFPLSLLVIVEHMDITLGKTIWLSSGYYCLTYALLLRFALRVDVSGWRTGIVYTLLTAFVGIPILYIWHNLPLGPFKSMLDSDAWSYLFLGHTVHTGLLEEGCKLLPLIFIGMRRNGISTEGDGLWLGIMAGLGFAWAEGVTYTIMYWNSSVFDQLAIIADGVQVGAGEDIVMADMVARSWLAFMSQQTRFLVLPILHAGFTAVAAVLSARAFLTGRWWWMGAGWLFAAILHGLYNSLADGLGGILVAAGVLYLLIWLADRTRSPIWQVSGR